jgi:hypothetical protein
VGLFSGLFVAEATGNGKRTLGAHYQKAVAAQWQRNGSAMAARWQRSGKPRVKLNNTEWMRGFAWPDKCLWGRPGAVVTSIRKGVLSQSPLL